MGIKKNVLTYLIKPLLILYLKKTRPYRYKQLYLEIFSGVFHPRFFFSSKYLADFIEKLNLENQSFCEACAGSGLVSLVAFRKTCKVTCFDLNELAVKNIQHNFKLNFHQPIETVNFKVYHSDGFQNIPLQTFDYIAINPPYFFMAVEDKSQLAWNCGENGEFFQSFYMQLKNYLASDGSCFMVLADNCEIERIKTIAENSGFNFILETEKKIIWEKNYIFKITHA
jgi:release factor glutamine methyltransferase